MKQDHPQRRASDARKRDPRTYGLGVFCAFACISRAAAYLTPGTVKPVGIDVLTQYVALWVFAVAWFAAGVGCIYTAVTGSRTPRAITLPAAPAILWGVSYIVTQIVAPSSIPNWATGALYLCLAGLIVCFGLVRPHAARAVPGKWTQDS
jgi:hypothetical protein